MAFIRRATSSDDIWSSAWTADTIADLAAISAILGSARPHHGDIAFVTANSQYYLWMDDGTWRVLFNTLSGYEEGDFNTDLSFGGLSVGITYTSRLCKYTKVGRLVIMTGLLTLSNKGSSVGGAAITLPFPVVAAGNSSAGCNFHNMAATVNNLILSCIPATSTANLYFPAAGMTAQATDVQFNNNSVVVLQANYFTT